jgi:thiamine-phosphate diphosphorylase / hydroxyethylthiazole kinase
VSIPFAICCISRDQTVPYSVFPEDVKSPLIYEPELTLSSFPPLRSAGATAVRRAATKTILNAGYLDVIKGNRAEILACTPAGAQTQQRGVDSGDAESGGGHEKAEAEQRALAATVRALAAQRRNVVVATGRTDLIAVGGAHSGGTAAPVLAVANGHAYLGAVTGTGCCLGTAISAMVAASPDDKLGATLAALLLYEIAAEVAAARPDVRGPGTFVPAFLDELYNLRVATANGDVAWLDRAKVSVVAL